MLSPPTKAHNRKSVNFAISLVTANVCNANSLVGARINALAPFLSECFCNAAKTGTTNAAVFPLPVLAIATTSTPVLITGIAFL